jgi:hypothetical protein
MARPGLQWGFKTSFRGYVERVGGRVDVSAPAQSAESEYFFPFVGREFDGEHGATLLRFAGAVSFHGHGGLLSLTIAAPTVVFHDGSIILSVAHPSDPTTLLPLADLVAPTREGPIAATLTTQGSELLRGIYPVGAELDVVRLVLPQAGARATDTARQSPEAEAAGGVGLAHAGSEENSSVTT